MIKNLESRLKKAGVDINKTFAKLDNPSLVADALSHLKELWLDKYEKIAEDFQKLDNPKEQENFSQKTWSGQFTLLLVPEPEQVLSLIKNLPQDQTNLEYFDDNLFLRYLTLLRLVNTPENINNGTIYLPTEIDE